MQNVVTYSTVISVPNPDFKLKPGMTANVTIEIARRNNVLRAPNAALRFRPTNDIFAALKQEVPQEMQRGFGGRDGQNAGGPGGGGNRGAGFNGASGQQGQPAASSQAAPGAQASGGAQRPSTAPGPTPSTPPASSGERRRDPAAQGGGDRAQGDRPQGERAQGQGGEGRRGFGDMTPEQREAFRKQREERMKNMTPEEREAMQARMRNGGGRGAGQGGGQDGTGGTSGGGRGTAPGGRQGDQRAATSANGGSTRQPGERSAASAADTGSSDSPIMATKATTIDALFAPITILEGRGRVWLYINKQLKLVNVRTGVTDGTWTEIIETPEVAQQLKEGTDLVTNVTTGLEQQNRPGQQGAGGNPLMGPQRGNQQRGGGPGGPGGGGRGR